jgi:transglutaminase-like putative cysteine protease
MRSRLLLTGVTFLCVLAAPAAAPGTQPAERTFEFTYRTTINNVPEGAKRVSIWLPYPVSDGNQEISDIRIQSPYPVAVHRDPFYGNSILYVDVENPKVKTVPIEMDFKVKRREYVRRDFEASPPAASGDNPSLMARWLQPDALVPIDGKIRKLAEEVTQGKTTDLARARAIYDYVVSTMKYDKTGTGWGRGDIYYACDVKKGNCTDFHALFIGLCRSVGIPAKFDIGFPLPSGRSEGEIGGYHCWAEFFLKGHGWVPVDASEASKNPDKRDYFFGAHDENRVQLTIGRDIRLDPPQSGGPMNYFIYPYVEVDGKPYTDLDKKFTFKDAAPAGERASTSGPSACPPNV